MLAREICAVFALLMGVVLCAVGMFQPPVGEIHGSVLNVTAQLLIFSGASLGIEAYVRFTVNRMLEKKGGGSSYYDAGGEKQMVGDH